MAKQQAEVEQQRRNRDDAKKSVGNTQANMVNLVTSLIDKFTNASGTK
jgi:hypothetical protein